VGLTGAVLVAASPVRPVQPVWPVSPRWRDDGVAQEPQQFRDGDRDQSVVWVRTGLVLALQGDGDGEVDVGEQADRGPGVPGLPAEDLSGVQAGALLGELMIFFRAVLRPWGADPHGVPGNQAAATYLPGPSAALRTRRSGSCLSGIRVTGPSLRGEVAAAQRRVRHPSAASA
jgi:hypothetical protein